MAEATAGTEQDTRTFGEILNSFRSLPDDPPTDETASTEPETTPAEGESTAAEPTPESAATAPEAAPETPETTETATPPEGAEPAPETDVVPPAASPTAEAPPAAESTEAEDVEFAFSQQKRFRLSELKDPAKLKEFVQEFDRGLMRETRYTQQRQQETAQLGSALTGIEDRTRLITEIITNAEMAKVIAEFGPTTDIVQRLVRNPDLARQILQSPRDIEELWNTLEREREQPGLRFQRETVERTAQENAQLRNLESIRQAEAQLANFGTALAQTIDNFAAAYPDVNKQEVEAFVLSLGGLTPQDFEHVNPAKVVPGLMALQRHFLGNVNGVPTINPLLIQREFERMKAVAGTTAPPAQNGKPPVDDKAAAHNAAVREKLADSPPPVLAGDSPSETSEAPASSYQQVMSRFRDIVRGADQD